MDEWEIDLSGFSRPQNHLYVEVRGGSVARHSAVTVVIVKVSLFAVYF